MAVHTLIRGASALIVAIGVSATATAGMAVASPIADIIKSLDTGSSTAGPPGGAEYPSARIRFDDVGRDSVRVTIEGTYNCVSIEDPSRYWLGNNSSLQVSAVPDTTPPCSGEARVNYTVRVIDGTPDGSPWGAFTVQYRPRDTDARCVPKPAPPGKQQLYCRSDGGQLEFSLR